MSWTDEHIHQAIRDVAAEGIPDLPGAARWTLIRLWRDLAEAMRYAHRGCWSMGCDAALARIVVLTSALGQACPRSEVPPAVLACGLYDRVHAHLGIPVSSPAPASATRPGERRTAP